MPLSNDRRSQHRVTAGAYIEYRVTMDGTVLEGLGVAPTREIPRLIPYSAGADPVLDAAVAELAGN